ncbi:glutaredoxin family protein [Synechococcus sp. M16CYN]|uniref:glutaredoxin family protein n=1 Tax=Synechococcus sp. M16CYN TaxID=3103139 RepID=UPI003253E7FB
MHELRLYSRQGCCLCASLERRLRALDFNHIRVTLIVVDIDAPEVPTPLKVRYDLEVPVLFLDTTELPRVPPRLAGDRLMAWLIKTIT